MDELVKEAAAAPPARRMLTASPAMRARLGLVEVKPPPAKPDPEPVGVAAPQPARKSRWRGRGVFDPALDAMLRERWPVAFCVPRLPLAIGIREQILDVAGTEVDAKALGLFLAWWVARSDYLDAIAHGEARRNLDGSPAGEPDEAQRRQAAGEVYGHRAEAVLGRIEARRQAAAEPAP